MSNNLIKIASKRKTKIVATLGPASSSPEVICNLIKAGINVARLNFSHGTYEEHTKILNTVRGEAAKLGKHIAVFQDLCGPKVRIGELEGGEAPLTEGETVTLRHFEGQKGNKSLLFVEAFDPVKVIKPGEKALLSDGQIELIAKSVTADGVQCIVSAGGMLRSRSGIAVPDSKLNLKVITDKDIRDVEWAVKNKVDYIALSFVGSERDVLDLRDIIQKHGVNIPIIAKVERASSLDHVAEIVEAADAVMVARGDLGLELPPERVPGAQKLIIESANYRGTPVITATQMLQSMVKEIRPTRAEVSDVFTAVRDGTDCVMLSEETALGKHPVETVQILDRILYEAEREFEFEQYRPRLKGADRESVADAICYAACGAANKIAAAAIVACTQGGRTARLIAKYRPQQTLFGATSEPSSLAKMALYWGVIPVLIKVDEEFDTEEEVIQAMTAIRDQYGAKPGSRVVLTAGLRAKKQGTTNLMEIREIPRGR